MSLKHFNRSFKIDPIGLDESDILSKAKKEMGKPLYGMANRVFSEFVQRQDESISAGYFKFAFIIGDSGQAPKKDVDYLWQRMEEIYGTSDRSYDFIKRVLGTICMKCVAEDKRQWVYRDDMDKKKKLASGDIPDATEYWVVK